MKTALSFLFVSITVCSQVTAQTNPAFPTRPEAFICNYTGHTTDEQVICSGTTSSNAHAQKVVDRILKPIGLMRNFKIMECSNTENCFATVLKGQRYIVYDGAFMKSIEEETETDWSAISIMAHEIGHHLQGHTIDGRGGQPQKEIEADKFSGFVLHQLGASLEESMVAVRALGDEHATSTHPAKPARLDAIRKGWLEAEALYPRTRSAVKPAVAISPKPITPAASPLSTQTSAPARTINRPVAATVGCISGDCEDGKGIFVYPTRERYVGEFEEGDKHGEGTEYYADGKLKYKGNFRDNLRSDYGVYFYRNGDKYAGWFQKNVPNGKGIYQFADGARLTATFKNGQPLPGGSYAAANSDRGGQ
ncbi:M48 family metalloprotease [Spirosoma sp. KUDC1026]|uniref:M48 family metalloprotease n=1 Tax=Spirosoma sp. KUDC1026 TaxID=2745947 RepID=UPI00159BA562|nr:M48 family metalloprotease [Spirosoma sp. KUDC1026]QKZ11373.1 M48 family metalloprotease [Spirosoma sp. KUDC1026]